MRLCCFALLVAAYLLLASELPPDEGAQGCGCSSASRSAWDPPQRTRDETCSAHGAARDVPLKVGPGERVACGTAHIPGGWFLMGSDDAYAHKGDEEGPVRKVRVAAFRLDTCEVTNQQVFITC